MANNIQTTASSLSTPPERTLDLQGLGYGNLFRQHDQAPADLHAHLAELEATYASRYDELNRKEKVEALFADLGELTSLPDGLDALLARLADAPIGQWMKLYSQPMQSRGERPNQPSTEPDEPPKETVTLGDTDENVTLEGMGDAALELNLSADERNEEYHGEFSFDGSGPAEINTFVSEESDSEYLSPTGTYHLFNSESVTLNVAEDTGFGGTIHADAARSLQVDAPGFLDFTTTLHAANLTDAIFNVGFTSLYADDVDHGGTYHRVNLDAENLQRLTVMGDARFRLISIADSDALQRLDAVTDGELLIHDFGLRELQEVNLSGAGRVVLSSNELASSVESISVDAGELRGEWIPSGEDALSMDIQAFDGAERGTADVTGSHVGQSLVSIAGRDMTYTGDGTGFLRYHNVGVREDKANFSIDAGPLHDTTEAVQTLDVSMWDVIGHGDISRENVALTIEGNSHVETGDFHVFTGATLLPETGGGMVSIDTDNAVTLNRYLPYDADTATYHGAFFSRDIGDTRWSVDEDGLFDGTFDLGVSIKNESSDTLDALLFGNDEGELFLLMDTDAQPGIEDGADAFHLAEAGEGWVNGGSVQSAAEVDSFIDANALALVGVGETTIIDPSALA